MRNTCETAENRPVHHPSAALQRQPRAILGKKWKPPKRTGYGRPRADLTPDLFVAHVARRSMEPRIADRSLNLFRLHPIRSRQNKILLIQRLRAPMRAHATPSKSNQHQGCDRRSPVAARTHPARTAESRVRSLRYRRGKEFAVVAEWLRMIE